MRPQEKPTDGLLWHYTSWESAVSILSGGGLNRKGQRKPPSIWASEASCLNDTGELESGFRTFFELLSVSAPVDEELWRRHFPRYPSQIFVFCLSRRADDLSQWRGYGGAGVPVSLGFNRTFLHTLVDGAGGNLQEVCYSVSEKENLFHEELASCRPPYERLMKIKEGEYKNADPGSLLMAESDAHKSLNLAAHLRLLPIAALAKDLAFKDEEEVRAIIHSPYGDTHSEDQFGVFVRDRMLVPYLEIPLVLPQPDVPRHLKAQQSFPIVEMIVGPGPHLESNVRYARERLRGLGHSAMRVIGSGVTYRNW